MNQSKKLFLLSLSMLCFSAKTAHAAADDGAGIGGNQQINVVTPEALVKAFERVLDSHGFPTKEKTPSLKDILCSMVNTNNHRLKTVVLTLFIASIVKFIITDPNNKPVRYHWNEITQGKNLLNNLKYLILDGLIGHRSKRPSLRTYPDNKVSPELCEMYADQLKPEHKTVAVVLRPGAEAKGVYGYIYELADPILKAATMWVFIDTWQKGVAGGLNSFFKEYYA